MNNSDPATPPNITATDVATFLVRHPDFLAENAALIARLTPPARFTGMDNVVDLQRHVIDQLQEDKKVLLSSRQELIETTQSNLTIVDRTLQASLAILDATTFDALMITITDILPILLDTDQCVLVFEPDRTNTIAAYPCTRFVPFGFIGGCLPAKAPYKLHNNIKGAEALYHGVAHLVQSEAIFGLTLPSHLPRAMLTLASYNPDTFSPDQAVDMLSYLVQVLQRKVSALFPSTTPDA